MPALAYRLFFGVLMAATAITLLAVDAMTGRSFGIAGLAALALALGMREILSLLRPLGVHGPAWPLMLAAVLLVGVQVARHEGVRVEETFDRKSDPDLEQGPLFMKSEVLGKVRIRVYPLPRYADVALITTCLMLVWASGLRSQPTRDELTSRIAKTFAVLYVLGLGLFALRVRYLDEHVSASFRGAHPAFGTWMIFYAIAMAKLTDVFAFFTGKFLGRQKLIPWISPGKTVAGLVGALAGAAVVSVACSLWTPVGRVFPFAVALPLGILLGVVAVIGDLVESLIKRGVEAKDAASLVPEFGGVLDVIDSILFVMPCVYAAALVSVWWSTRPV